MNAETTPLIFQTAALSHQGTNTLDTTSRTGSKLRHADSFLVVSI